MRTPHLVVSDLDADVAALSAEQDRHVRRVLRIRDGAQLSLTDGRGMVADGVLTGDGASVRARRDAQQPPDVTLLVAVSKGRKLDLVVEKTTELGVSRIVPVMTHRSERRWEDAKARAKVARLEAVARSALEQCRGAWLPQISLPLPWNAAIGNGNAAIGNAATGPGLSRVVLHPADVGDGESGAGAILSNAPAEIAVGPEGGFSDEEIDAAVAAGWRVVGLGPRLLRTETAAVVAVALVLAARGGLR